MTTKHDEIHEQRSGDFLLFDPNLDQQQYRDDINEADIVKSNRIIWIFGVLLIVLIVWAYFAKLTEVSTGTGKIIPNSGEQIIQSLEGGIISKLYVREGDVVEPQQILAQLDLTKTEATVGESAAKHRAALASIARLEAEVNGHSLEFPEILTAYSELMEAETRLYNTRQLALEESLSGLRQSLSILNEELRLTESLAKVGAASHVEVLKLQRQVAEIRLKLTERKAEYMVKAREELARAKGEAGSLEEVVRGRTDSLSRLTLRSPVRGVVKDIEVTTQGGVIPPNGRMMVIVPVEDKLLVETRIAPRDIAFIRPGLEAKVKVTAYDYSTYGALNGKVETVSPDTIQDEIKPEVFYYRAFIRTNDDALINEETGMRYPIVPGMIATVDITTGEKTVFEYLMKPVNRAQEALRER